MPPHSSSDSFWADAVRALNSVRLDEVVVLGTSGLDEFVPGLLPLELSWAMADQRLFFCASKDDVHRLAPWIFHSSELCYLWANEVFVIGSVGSFAQEKIALPAINQHLASWLDLVAARKLGCATSRLHEVSWYSEREESNHRPATLKVLVVGASGMGNVGDDLLAQCLRGIFKRAGGVELAFADPDLDPLLCQGFDIIVAGPGGILYGAREGKPEYANLVNYLKFAFIAEASGAQFWLIGVGDQQSPAIEELPPWMHRFLRSALQRCQLATARDPASAQLMKTAGAPEVVLAEDLVFGMWRAAETLPHPVRCGATRIALCGEWFDYHQLGEVSDLLCSRKGQAMLGGLDFQILLFSEDDIPHADRLRGQLAEAGHSIFTVDCRSLSPDRLFYLFKGYDLLMTTRFHAMVIAMLCHIPFLAADRPGGKKHRLLKQYPAYHSGCLVSDDRDFSLKGRRGDELLGALAVARTGVMVDKNAVQHLARLAALTETAMFEKLKKILEKPPMTKVASPRLTEIVNGAGSVRLCWAAASPQTEGFGNLGDSLSAVMVSALSGLPVVHTNFDARGDKLVAVGSIAHAIKGGKAVLWGPGVSIRGGVLADNVKLTEYDVRALRGAISASHLEGFGITVPPCFGDPVWLLPSIFNEPVEKKYELGVIPHLLDVDGFGPDAAPKRDSLRYQVSPEWGDKVTIINTWHPPTWEGIVEKLRLILSCKRILSQSFHGVVIGETYKIPVMNFRHIPGKPTGLIRFSTEAECTTDPRIYEFYKAAGVQQFLTYAQRRDVPSDWGKIIETIDNEWKPLEADLQPLIDAFPLPLAYDPLQESCPNLDNISRIKF